MFEVIATTKSVWWYVETRYLFQIWQYVSSANKRESIKRPLISTTRHLRRTYRLLKRHSWLEINQQQLLFVMTAIFSGHILDTFPGRPHYPPPPPKKTHVFHIAHGNLQTLGGQHITCSGSGGKGGNQGVTHREDSLQRICCHIRELLYRKKMSLLWWFYLDGSGSLDVGFVGSSNTKTHQIWFFINRW